MVRAEAELTPTQQEVLNLMWETTTFAEVGRRRLGLNGKYELYKVKQPTRPIDFAQEGEFTLKLHERRPDDPLSPYYINLRSMPDNLLSRVAAAIAEATDGFKADFVTGIPQAGTPISIRYAEVTGIPHREIYSKASSESGRKIVAHSDALQGNGSRLLILDDLITEADTKLEAAETSQRLGYEVAGMGVLVDRQQGGVELLEDRGFRLAAPISIASAFEYYYLSGRLDWSHYSESMTYLNAVRSSSGLPKLELLNP